MKKLLKYLKIGSCCFALSGVIFGSIYSVIHTKDFTRTMAVGNSPILPQNGVYYNAMEEISISTGSSITLKHNYNLSSYVYSNPDYWDTRDTILSTQQTSCVIDLINPYTNVGFVYNGIEYTALRYSRAWDTYLTFELYDDNSGTWGMLMYYDYTLSLYVYIPTIPLYQQFFSGNFTIYVQDNLTTEEINLYKYLAYYFSDFSPNYLTLDLNTDLKASIISLFADGSYPLVLNNSVFHSSYLENEIGYTYLFTDYTLGVGGYYSNNQYFNTLRVFIGSIYYPPVDDDDYITYASDNSSSEYILSNNESYKGYYYISMVQFTKVYKVQGGLRYDPYTIYQVTEKESTYRTTYVMNYNYTDINYRSIKVLYSKSGYIDTSYTLSFTTFLSSLGNVTPYANIFDTPIVPQTPFAFTQVFDWISIAFIGLSPFFNFQIAQGISLGVILATPLVITIILFIIKLFKR